MPTHQAIIDEEDRNFNSSLGNWTGDAVWEVYVPATGYGVASLILAAGETDKEMQLAYPALQPGANYTQLLRIDGNVIPGGPTIVMNWQLTDGVYTFSGTQDFIYWPNPQTLGAFIDLPSDFDPGTAVLTISAHMEEQEEEYRLAIPYVSMTWETLAKVQYLPIVGVG